MQYSILIIEDELLIAKDISCILQLEGYKTKYGITDVDNALEELKKHTYDLVLIDINLQFNSNGTKIGSYLLEKKNVPYIYITSCTDKHTVEQIKATRPHGIIVKPFKSIDIITTVSIVLNNYKYIDELTLQQKLSDEIPFKLRNVIEYINLNLTHKIEINQLASMTNWSQQHFIKIFTQFIGITPYQYILHNKIEKAKIAVAETDLVLNAVAVDLGFESYSNFFNAFKKGTGFSPDVYRKKIRIQKGLKNQ